MMAAESKKELFISYGREPETVNFVRLLKRDLEKNGLSIWLDAEDIIAGCDWYSAIGQGLENCKGIIAVITNKYINSHYCKSELYTANNDRKLIFPIIFEDVDFSSGLAAKGVKYIISGINWTMFRPSVDDYHTSLTRLCQGMKEQGLGKVGGAECAAADSLASDMNRLNVSGNGSEAPPTAPPPSHHHYQTPPHAPPTAAPPHSYQTPPHPSQHPSPHGSGYHPPYPTDNTYPPYQTTPPHPGYPQPHPGYGYGYAPPQPGGYAPPHGYGYMPQPTQHPGMYAPPVTMPQATPPKAPAGAEYTDHGPPVYSDLYPAPAPHMSHLSPSQPAPPSPASPQPTTVESLPEKPPSTSSSVSEGGKESRFKVGMKLEAVDRRFPYFVCVATVMDRSESEVLIHFDGWSESYDYWCPSDSVELHPPGWCAKYQWELQTPNGQEWYGWEQYLSDTEADKAPDHYFNSGQLSGPGSLLFRPGMRVEAKDRHNPSLICAASIKRINPQGKLLVNFDGWSEQYDYWCEPSSTDIHPPMWCGKNSRQVQPPRGYITQFKWSEYLTTPGMIPAPAHLFNRDQLSADGGRRSPRPASAESLGQFEVDMKLEAKDRLNPNMIAVATIINIRDGRLLIHFDGWTSKYDYWCKPTSPDIHPMGWCSRHGLNLHPPKGMDYSFSWNSYLQQCSARAAPNNAFTESQK